MKEIRYYIKRISEFPTHLIQIESISIESLWHDTMMRLTGELNQVDFLKTQNWKQIQSDLNIAGLHSMISYLLVDEESTLEKFDNLAKDHLASFLKDQLPLLAEAVSPYTEWINDGERSEELVRSLFHFLDVLPSGESKDYFKDRYKSIDTIERFKILEESKKSQERAKEMLRKIKQAEEEEAASKYNRE